MSEQQKRYNERFFNKTNLKAKKEKTSFSNRLRELRTKTGLSQEDVSRELIVTKSAYGYYENSHALPDADTIARLADLFDCTSDYLLGLSDSPDSNALVNLFDTNFSQQCNNALLSIAKSKVKTDIFEMLITNKKFHKLLNYMDTYLTFSHKIDKEIRENYDQYQRAMYVDSSRNDYISIESYPSEKLRVSDVYLSLIENTFIEMMKDISKEHSYTFRKKLNRIISEEISKH